MSNKISLALICAISFALFSCNQTEEKKEELSSSTIINPMPQASMPPPIDLTPFEKQFEADSTNFELRAMLASKYYSAGALSKAAYHFLKIYEHDNKNLSALTNLGNIYYDSKQDDNAIQFYEKALEIDPKNINLRCDLATCYSNINKLKKAIQILKENIEMDKNHAQSHYNLSIILQKKGDVVEAKSEMEEYKKLTTK